MSAIEKARIAFQKDRKERRKTGRTPSYRTAFYAGYLAAAAENDMLRGFIKAHVEHEEKLVKQIEFLKEGV